MKLKIFCRCSLFPSWSGQGLTSTSVVCSLMYLHLCSYAHAPNRVINWTYEVATSVQRWWPIVLTGSLFSIHVSPGSMGAPPPTPSRSKLYSWVMSFVVNDTEVIIRLSALSDVTSCVSIVRESSSLLPFINQHLCTTLCLRNHLLVTTSILSLLYWRHFQGDLLPVFSSQHIQVIINACWPLSDRSFLSTVGSALNIINL
jgi:hypothetical protein